MIEHVYALRQSSVGPARWTTASPTCGVGKPHPYLDVDTLSRLGQPSGTMSRGRSSPGSLGRWLADACVRTHRALAPHYLFGERVGILVSLFPKSALAW